MPACRLGSRRDAPVLSRDCLRELPPNAAPNAAPNADPGIGLRDSKGKLEAPERQLWKPADVAGLVLIIVLTSPFLKP